MYLTLFAPANDGDELRGGPGGHPLAYQSGGRPNPTSVAFMIATSAPAHCWANSYDESVPTIRQHLSAYSTAASMTSNR